MKLHQQKPPVLAELVAEDTLRKALHCSTFLSTTYYEIFAVDYNHLMEDRVIPWSAVWHGFFWQVREQITCYTYAHAWVYVARACSFTRSIAHSLTHSVTNSLTDSVKRAHVPGAMIAINAIVFRMNFEYLLISEGRGGVAVDPARHCYRSWWTIPIDERAELRLQCGMPCLRNMISCNLPKLFRLILL